VNNAGEFSQNIADIETQKKYNHYDNPQVCLGCHIEKFGMWKTSQMSRAFTGDFFQAQYYKLAVVDAGRDEKVKGLKGFVEGAAKVTINIAKTDLNAGEKADFSVKVHHLAPGHKFPSGASEERDVWLHLGIYDHEGNELDHIKIPANPDDPNDKYFITTNEKVAYPTHSRYSKPIERDSLPEGDRLYHSAFIDSDGNFTYAQWYATKDIENRLKPLEERIEQYRWTVPDKFAGKTVKLRAVLNYRRMPDSYAKYLGIKTRPTIEVSRDERILKISK